jgi:hypothetical protein
MVQLSTTQSTIYSLYKRVENPDEDIDNGEKIEVSSDFQRGDEETGVWSLDAKRDYINSLELNYPTGLISIVKPLINGSSTPYKVLDGGNRVRAIRDFMNNKFSVGGLWYSKSEPESNIGVRRQESLKHTCLAFQTISIERSDPDTTISEMFTRLNTSSVPLKPGELIKSHGWLKNKPVIEMAKYFIGDTWETEYSNDVIMFIRSEWVKVFCGGDPTKLREGKRCDSMAMICAFIVSSITGDFTNFDRRYDSIKEHLDIELTPEQMLVFANKITTFLDIMKEIYTRDIFSIITNGIPSRKMVAPVWYKICDGSMTPELEGKMKRFFKTMLENNQLKMDYLSLRDKGSNGETNIGKMGKIIALIEEWEE